MNEKVLKEIIEKYDTPIYVFDIKKLKERIKYLKNLMPKDVLMCYAIKANTFIIKDIENDVDRFEVCSPGEYSICKERKIAPEKILISGVYKTPEIIEEMINQDEKIGYYTIESMEQFYLLKKQSKNHKINIMLRLTSGNQFGINKEEIEEIVKDRKEYEKFNIKGIQYFAGTQRKSQKMLKKELDTIDEFIEMLYNKYDFKTEELEFGPGFPVNYFENSDFDEKNFIKEFAKNLEDMKFSGKKIIELGRSIASCSGNYITKVVDKKTNKSENYAIVDGGINHLVYYGQSMAMKVPKCAIYPKRDNLNRSKMEYMWLTLYN